MLNLLMGIRFLEKIVLVCENLAMVVFIFVKRVGSIFKIDFCSEPNSFTFEFQFQFIFLFFFFANEMVVTFFFFQYLVQESKPLHFSSVLFFLFCTKRSNECNFFCTWCAFWGTSNKWVCVKLCSWIGENGMNHAFFFWQIIL